MKTANPIHTKRRGPFPCKGKESQSMTHLPPSKRFVESTNPQRHHMNAQQLAWMKANKPLYTGCSLTEALPHLPLNLRFV